MAKNKSKYYDSEEYAKAHVRAQVAYRVRKTKARQDYFFKTLGYSPDLSKLTDIEQKVVLLYYGAKDGRSPIGVKAIQEELGVQLKLVKSALASAKQKLNLRDTEPS